MSNGNSQIIWEKRLADSEQLCAMAALARAQCVEIGKKSDPSLFKINCNDAARICGERVLSGKITYQDAESEMAFFARCFPPHDFDYAITALQKFLERHSREQARVSRAIREKCVPMIIAVIDPEKIRQAASALNSGILSDDEITEILRTE